MPGSPNAIDGQSSVGEGLGFVAGFDKNSTSAGTTVYEELKKFLGLALISVEAVCEVADCGGAKKQGVSLAPGASPGGMLVASAGPREEMTAAVEPISFPADVSIGTCVVGTVVRGDPAHALEVVTALGQTIAATMRGEEQQPKSCQKINRDDTLVAGNHSGTFKLYFEALGAAGGLKPVTAASGAVQLTVTATYSVKMERYRIAIRERCRPPECKHEKGEVVALLKCALDVTIDARASIDLGFGLISGAGAGVSGGGSAHWDGDLIAKVEWECAAPPA